MFGLFFLSEGIDAVNFASEHGGEFKTTFRYS
jgi:hypothetical protein